MILTLKNGMLMAFDQILEEAEKHGGNPKNIILTPHEAVDFLIEIKDNPTSKERLVVLKNSVPLITLKIWRAKDTTMRDVNDVVRKWYTKDYTFRYKGVKIIVAKSAKDQPKETRRTAIKPFNCWGISPTIKNTIKTD